MTCTQLVAEAERRTQEQAERIRAKVATLDDEAWQRTAPGSDWSPGGILEHMMLGNAAYFPALEAAVPGAKPGGGTEAKSTLFGRILLKAAGPSGNAPAPQALVPGPGPWDREATSARWLADQARFGAWLASLRDVDLSRTKIRNPLVPLFRMNLVDCVLVLTEHTERHVRQIEAAT